MGMNDSTEIELIHTKFLRRILGVKKSTNLSALYGEVGRAVLARQEDIQNIKEDADRNLNYGGKNWAAQIKSILQQLCLEYVWQLQSKIRIAFETIKLRIFDTYKQN